MDSRNSLKRSVTICVITAACLAGPLHAGHIYTYSRDFTDLRIPANPGDTKGWMTPAVIDVTDHHIILDIDIGITLTHTKAFDLQLFLQNPAGKRVLLNYYNPYFEYFDGEDYFNTVFDDEAPLSIQDAAPPFTGRFRPRQARTLSKFYGTDAYGTWQFQVYDAAV
ncbi:MAG: proprotein convertase P-domain-containing protein [Planctomycetota bacterium]|jgi:subtilisin-like proprotein convertase family protein